jgi:hypothetical protein
VVSTTTAWLPSSETASTLPLIPFTPIVVPVPGSNRISPESEPRKARIPLLAKTNELGAAKPPGRLMAVPAVLVAVLMGMMVVVPASLLVA